MKCRKNPKIKKESTKWSSKIWRVYLSNFCSRAVWAKGILRRYYLNFLFPIHRHSTQHRPKIHRQTRQRTKLNITILKIPKIFTVLKTLHKTVSIRLKRFTCQQIHFQSMQMKLQRLPLLSSMSGSNSLIKATQTKVKRVLRDNDSRKYWNLIRQPHNCNKL